jgi:hypothetical protein
MIACLGLVARAFTFPGPNIDIYFKDRYVVVSKRSLVVATLVVLLILITLFVGAFRLLQSLLH